MESAGAQRLRTLVADHYAAVYRYAYRLCGNAVDAEDVTQQAFLRAQRSIDQLRDADRADRWLLRIARNEFLRSRAARSFSSPLVTDPPTSGGIGVRPEAGAAIEQVESVQHAIGSLPDDYRLPVLLFYFEELSYREIAAELNIPIGTVMSRLSRAKSHLREQFEREGAVDPASPQSPPSPALRPPSRP